ncbi:calcium/sodium antiporter [Thiomicrorhabdus sp. zzn3]|uniref:calcium/sodium antiporter n=1 Tax=Thiomicrorhabdus sp. zzn3 TaxID=3039775 RepID=UPI002436A907|nr:calcium/sodium antiporter [Thiomicrorhabdus sp. zzn3]MDG6777421.1 calcium/sodium antiporter [Thiomicrorhabdus sp. zzn3]
MATALLLPSFILLIGLALLVWSSDVFIDGSVSTAKHLSISPLIIGVVVLGFGTSMPEVLVAIQASLDNSPELAIGNAVGSNIANIGLVLGVTAIIAPIAVKSSLIKREIPVLLAISIGAYLLVIDQRLEFIDGLILLAGLVIAMIWMIRVNKDADPRDPLTSETSQAVDTMSEMPLKKSLILLITGLLILMGSAKMMVWGAVEIAQYFEVSELVIGLTIIAIGTSLPELAAAISAALKNEADLMIGNIVGSNLFNILAVMSVPALLAPTVLESALLNEDFPIMLGFTLAMLVLALSRRGGPSMINKFKGVLLFIAFISYIALLYMRSIAA